MPDRDKVKVGDTVYAIFWDGVFTYWTGTVHEDLEGLYIHTENNARGYLKDAHEVRRAIISGGYLHRCKDTEHGTILVCYPMLQDGTVELDNEVIPEPENVDEQTRQDLQRIAKFLGCKLY